MVSDFQQPKSWMMLGSTSAQRRAMVPPAQRDWAEISFAVKPMEGPMMAVAMQRATVMSLDRMPWRWLAL